MGVFILDEALDGTGGGTDHVGIIHIHIDALHGLPSHPVLDAVLKHSVGDDQHLHGRFPKFRVLVIKIQNGAAVEQLLVKDIEIRAIGLYQHVFGCLGVGTFEVYFHLDVVEHAEGVVHGVIADGFDGDLSYLDAA